MSETVQGGTPAVLTPRLVFDTVNEDDIPQFLRKQRAATTDPDQKPAIVPVISEPTVVISEPEVSVAIDTPVETSMAPIVVPTAIEEKVEHQTHQELGSTTPPTNLDELSVEELKREQEEIQRRIIEKQQAEKQAVIDQIVEVVKTYQIPIEELVEALGGLKVKRKGVKATPKYKDPATGTIWTGRGKEPAWIKGKDRKAFLIAE